MEVIKAKIQTLKNEVEIKAKEIVRLEDEIVCEKERAENAEIDARKQENKLSEVEDDLENVEDEITKIRKRLEVAEEELGHIEHELRNYRGTKGTSACTLKYQTNELKKAEGSAKEAQQKYEEASRKLVALETELMETEENLETANTQNKEFDDFLHGVSTDLKSLQATKCKMTAMEKDCIHKVKMLESKLIEAEDEHERVLEDVKKMNLQNDQLEADLEDVTGKIQETTNELESTLADLVDA